MREVKVSKNSSPARTGGVLCNLFRESNDPIQIKATGAVAVNQAIKAIAVRGCY